MADRFTYENRDGVRRTMVWDEGDPDEKFTVITDQHVGACIREALRQREMNETIGHRKSRMMVPVAHVPMQVYEQAYAEGWLHDEKKWREWANNPQNQPFRITDGRY